MLPRGSECRENLPVTQLQVHVTTLQISEQRSPLWEGDVKKPLLYRLYSFGKIMLNVGHINEEYQVVIF